jgi:hypothetical protein
VAEYTGDEKHVAPITISTYQMLTWRRSKAGEFEHFALFSKENWGLVVYDEVHLLPAPIFRVTAELQARRRLGLTATLVREDGKEADVFGLIGPKRFDVPWKELELHGWIAPDSGLIDAPLGRDQRERMKMAVSDSATAKQSVTTFRVLERFEAGTYDDGFTLLECKLYTGRTHQIRVHMAYISHPCVGDQVYGQRKLKADLGLTRQFLHAYRLSLVHPVTGEELSLIDPPPEDLASRLKGLAEYSAGRTEAGDEVFGLLDAESARRRDG